MTKNLAASKKESIQQLREFARSPIPETDFEALVTSIMAHKSQVDAAYRLVLEHNYENHGINLQNLFDNALLQTIHASALQTNTPPRQ